MRAAKVLSAAGVRGVCSASKQSRRGHNNLANVSRVFSVVPRQTEAGSQDYAWAQHLLKACAGVGFAAGSLAVLGSSSARCEQQASAGQTVVCELAPTLACYLMLSRLLCCVPGSCHYVSMPTLPSNCCRSKVPSMTECLLKTRLLNIRPKGTEYGSRTKAACMT